MTWFKVKDNVYICLETSQEVSLRQNYKGWYIHQTNYDVVKQFDEKTTKEQALVDFNTLIQHLKPVNV